MIYTLLAYKTNTHAGVAFFSTSQIPRRSSQPRRNQQTMPTYVVTSSDSQPVVYRGRSRNRSSSFSLPFLNRRRSHHDLRRGRSKSKVRFVLPVDRDHHYDRDHRYRREEHHRDYRDYRDDSARPVYVVDRGRSRHRDDSDVYYSSSGSLRRRHSLETIPRRDSVYYHSTPYGFDPRSSTQVTYYPPGNQVTHSVPAVYPQQNVAFVQPTYQQPTVVATPLGHQVVTPTAYAMPATPMSSSFAPTFSAGQPIPVQHVPSPMAPGQFVVNAAPPAYPPGYAGAVCRGSAYGRR